MSPHRAYGRETASWVPGGLFGSSRGLSIAVDPFKKQCAALDFSQGPGFFVSFTTKYKREARIRVTVHRTKAALKAAGPLDA